MYEWFSPPLNYLSGAVSPSPVWVVQSRPCCPSSDCVPSTGCCPELDADLKTDTVSIPQLYLYLRFSYPTFTGVSGTSGDHRWSWRISSMVLMLLFIAVSQFMNQLCWRYVQVLLFLIRRYVCVKQQSKSLFPVLNWDQFHDLLCSQITASTYTIPAGSDYSILTAPIERQFMVVCLTSDLRPLTSDLRPLTAVW